MKCGDDHSNSLFFEWATQMASNQNHASKDTDSRRAAADDVLQRALKLIALGKYQKAVDLLNAKAIREGRHQNLKGVCLMRLGMHDEAVRVFRSICLNPGCTWMRPDAPALYKINFATALLLAGHPSGCLEILGEVRQEDEPSVQRLRAAIKKWVSGLSLMQKLNWWLGRIEPPNPVVSIDFEPGDLGIEVNRGNSPQPTTPPPNLRTAA